MKIKKKILAWADSPVLETGFAQVTKNVLGAVYKTGNYDITIVGVSHPYWLEEYDKEKYPYTIYKTIPGQSMGFNAIKDLLNSNQYDIFWSLNDVQQIEKIVPFVMKQKVMKRFSWINYSPTDSNLLPSHYYDSFNIIDYPIIYSEFALETLKGINHPSKDRAQIIHHGTDVTPTKYTEEQKNEIKGHFNIPRDRYVLMSVNRNQYRKDFPRLMLGYRRFKEKYPELAKDTVLVIHAKIQDVGGNLEAQRRYIFGGDEPSIIFSNIDTVMDGIPRDDLLKLMGITDLSVTATCGEGWGMTTHENMALGNPILVPNNSTGPMFTSDNKGWLVNSGVRDEDWTHFGGVSEVPRPLMDIEDFADKVCYIMTHKQETKEKAQKAQRWALERSWENIGQQWVELFKKAIQ